MPVPRPDHIPTIRAVLAAFIDKETLTSRAVSIPRHSREVFYPSARLPQPRYDPFLGCRAASLPHNTCSEAPRR